VALKAIAEKKWAYTLFQSEGGGYVLSVVCGGPAMYELNIPLSSQESAQAMASTESLDALAEKIRSNPKSYASRSIKL
jgi:hypothetical protein